MAARNPSAPPRPVRILTINAWTGLTYEGVLWMRRHEDHPDARYKALVAGIRELEPDIIAIQEANRLPAFAGRLAEDLDYRVVSRVALGGIRVGPFGIPWNLREGKALLVRKPWTVVDAGACRLGGRGIVTNGVCLHLSETTDVLLARTVVNGKPLYVYNVHLHSGPFHGSALDECVAALSDKLEAKQVEAATAGVAKDIDRRAREITRLRGFIEETLPAGAAAVLLGDFNTTTESGELDPLLRTGWTDSFAAAAPDADGCTWDPAGNPNCRTPAVTPDPYTALRAGHVGYPSRIDLILLNGQFPPEGILSSQVVLTGGDGIPPSDHYGVLTTIAW
jgi:endonuclease/exonuclease/phosphatase family metal-dependent hydrolase